MRLAHVSAPGPQDRPALRLPASVSDGGLLVAALVAGYFLVLLVLSLETSGAEAWRRLGVFSLEPSFADMRSVTSGWECTRAGLDVLPVNPCDPWQRPANYPGLWMAPAFLGLGQESTVYLGVGTAVIFFASFLFLVGPVRPLEALVCGAALCSPAVMLGVERGNVDLLLFAVVAGGVALLRRRPVVAHGLLFLAAVLKLFPVFAWGALIQRPARRGLVRAGALVAGFAAYVLATLDEIRTIWHAVPQEVQSSYGAGVAVQAGQDLIGRLEVTPLYFLTHPAAGNAARAALVLAGILLGLGLARRWRTRVVVDGGARELDAFWAGAGVFCATYALFQNYDYRLVFLLLTVPQLLCWARRPGAGVPLARCGLVAVLGALWLGTGVPFAPFGLGQAWVDMSGWFPLEELVNWLLLAYFAAAVVLTSQAASRWVRSSHSPKNGSAIEYAPI